MIIEYGVNNESIRIFPSIEAGMPILNSRILKPTKKLLNMINGKKIRDSLGELNIFASIHRDCLAQP